MWDNQEVECKRHQICQLCFFCSLYVCQISFSPFPPFSFPLPTHKTQTPSGVNVPKNVFLFVDFSVVSKSRLVSYIYLKFQCWVEVRDYGICAFIKFPTHVSNTTHSSVEWIMKLEFVKCLSYRLSIGNRHYWWSEKNNRDYGRVKVVLRLKLIKLKLCGGGETKIQFYYVSKSSSP